MMKDEDVSRILAVLAFEPTNEAAWRELFNVLWPFVIGIVGRRLRERTISEDAAQEVFMRLVRARPFPDISEAPQLRAYVWRVAINVASDAQRRKRKQALDDRSMADLEVPDSPAEAVQAEEHLIFGEALGLTRQALAPDENELLAHLIEGRTISETALLLGQTYSNTAVQMHRLRRKIFRLLKKFS